jgi:hypothetical protein
MTKNGRVFDLDLTSLVEPIHLKIGDYECSLSGDLPITALARLSRAFEAIGEGMKGSIAIEDLGISEDEMWALADEVLATATPAPTQSARELLTTPAAIKLLNFLATRVTAGLETKSSKA